MKFNSFFPNNSIRRATNAVVDESGVCVRTWHDHVSGRDNPGIQILIESGNAISLVLTPCEARQMAIALIQASEQ
jgi:hypothetical protein